MGAIIIDPSHSTCCDIRPSYLLYQGASKSDGAAFQTESGSTSCGPNLDETRTAGMGVPALASASGFGHPHPPTAEVKRVTKPVATTSSTCHAACVRDVDPIEKRSIPITLHDLSEGAGLLDLVTTSLDDDKAEDIVAIDMAGKSAISDHIVIASGRSQRHISAMASHLVKNLKDTGVGEIRIEGANQADWVLIDAGDVIVHLFRPDVREFYGLDKMWGGEDQSSMRTVQVGGGERQADGGPLYALA